MNKLVDSESLGKFKELMDEKLKNKVSKKKKSQVIIGRAIKPRACEIGGMENWYAFAGNSAVCLPQGISELDKVYVRDITVLEYSIEENLIQTGRVCNIHGSINSMWRVDRYEINENKLSIWLTYKHNQPIQKGTSTWLEINNGRKYDIRKITPTIIADYLDSIRYFSPNPDGISSTESYGVNLKRFGYGYRNSRVRKLTEHQIRKVKLRWKKLYFVRMTSEAEPVRRLRYMAGKYKISFINRRRAYSPPVTFFLRKTIWPNPIYASMITIE